MEPPRAPHRARLGQLLLALDRTMVTLVEAPRGLDLAVKAVALVVAADIRTGGGGRGGGTGVDTPGPFFLRGVSDAAARGRLDRQNQKVPAAIFVKDPTDALV